MPFPLNTLLLDPAGDAPIPAGYVAVATDTAWLRAAANVMPPIAPKILVRGKQRCDWARTWWQACGGQWHICTSPSTHLREHCPALTPAQAQQVLADLPDSVSTSLPSLPKYLKALYPSFGVNWETLALPAAPVALRRQAAHWLSWLTAQPNTFPAHHLHLIKTVISFWQQSHPAVAELFPTTPAEARLVLEAWVGYANPTAVSPALASSLAWAEQFPLPANQWLSDANQAFTKQLLAILSTAAPGTRDQAAFAWWQSQTNRLQRPEVHLAALTVLVQQLKLPLFADAVSEKLVLALERSPVITPSLATAIRHLIPPPLPPALPQTPAAVLNWATQYYLPYRRWQASQPSNTTAAAQAHTLAQQFSDWFLTTYPTHLVGTTASYQQQHWANRALQTPAADEIVLWVIADGLGWGDGLTLQRLITEGSAGRLSLAAATPCFSLLPTITSFTKRAVRWAVPLHHTEAARTNYFHRTPAPPADVRGNADLATAMQGALPGQMFIWQPPQPDSVYHQKAHVQIVRTQATAAISGLAESICQAVATVSPTVAVRVLITTDHGRLLSESPRTLEPLPGFTGHGRAAFRTDFPVTKPIPRPVGAVDTDTVRWLDPERYRLPDWIAVARTDASFKIVVSNGSMRGGDDIFPHGGAWPEEVVVPWIELQSRLSELEVHGLLFGEARSGRPATATLRLTNSSPRQAQLRQVKISIPRLDPVLLELDELIPGLSELPFSIDLPRWPDTVQADKIEVVILLETPDGKQHTFHPKATLLNTDLQQRTSNPLDDLF